MDICQRVGALAWHIEHGVEGAGDFVADEAECRGKVAHLGQQGVGAVLCHFGFHTEVQQVVFALEFHRQQSACGFVGNGPSAHQLGVEMLGHEHNFRPVVSQMGDAVAVE